MNALPKCARPCVSRAFVFIAAQTFSLLHRRIAFCESPGSSSVLESAGGIPIAILPCSRLKVCAATLGYRKALSVSRGTLLVFCFALVGCRSGPSLNSGRTVGSSTPEEKALTFLSQEVPLWHHENRCFSCHNNGDAARALFVGGHRAYRIAASTTADTIEWLTKPNRWDDNKGDPRFSDKHLARIQFAAALTTAIETGHIKDRRVLVRAADLVIESQAEDGAWHVGSSDSVGSPITYGPSLATHVALRILRAAKSDHLRTSIEKGERWLRRAPINSILDAAAILLALENSSDTEAVQQRDQCLSLIARGQSADGGWGPFPTAPPETFDTAIVLLALARVPPNPANAEQIRRGRNFLLKLQQSDGSWPETTRPPGAESYAHRLSTTGWATLALLETNRP